MRQTIYVALLVSLSGSKAGCGLSEVDGYVALDESANVVAQVYDDRNGNQQFDQGVDSPVPNESVIFRDYLVDAEGVATLQSESKEVTARDGLATFQLSVLAPAGLHRIEMVFEANDQRFGVVHRQKGSVQIRAVACFRTPYVSLLMIHGLRRMSKAS